MAVRQFSGANDEIRVAIGSAGPVGAYSFGLLFKRTTTSAWQALMGTHTSANVPTNTMELIGTGGADLNKIEHGTNDATFRDSTLTIATTNSYYLLIVTKATGTVTPRFHFYNLSTDGGRGAGTWTHENATGTAGNPASTAGGTMRWGEYNDADDASMYLAAAFVRSVEMADADCVAVVTAGLNTSSLYNAGGSTSVALWEFNQAVNTDPVLDLVGAAHSNGTGGAISGTTVSTTNDPPGWTFDGIGAAAATSLVIPRPPMRALIGR